MALPAGVTTCTVTINGGTDYTGDNAVARYTIQPVDGTGKPLTLVHAASGGILFPHPEIVTVGAGASTTIALPHTDQAGMIEAIGGQPYTGWAYRVAILSQVGRDVQSVPRIVHVPTSLSTADLDKLPAAALVTVPGVVTGSGLDTEAVQDIVGAMVTGAGGTYNDAAGTITLPSSGGGGGYPVQTLLLTANTTLDPAAWPTTEVVTLVVTQDATGGRTLALPANVITASGVAWAIGTAAGSESVATFRYSAGLAKWVCEGCWVSIAGGVPTDITAPTVGSMAASAITNSGFTLTVSGASDAGGLHANPYAFSIDGGTTWSAYQASAVYVVSGRPAATAHTVNWRVRDAAGNVSTGTAQTVTTSATADTTPPVWSATITLGTPTATKVIATASAQATDDTGVDHYEVSYDGGTTWSTLPMLGGWTFELEGTAGTTYATTELRAVDAAGNTSTPVVSVPSYTMAASQAVIASDTFTRADGPLAGSTTETGNKTWVVPDTYGSPTISSGAVGRSATGAPVRRAYIDVGTADMEVSMVIGSVGASSGSSLGARVGVMATENPVDGYIVSPSDGRIAYAGTGRTPAVSPAPVAGDTIALRVKDEEGGTRCTVFINGVEKGAWLNTAEVRPTSTTAGVYAPVLVGYPFDSFEVKAA